MVIRMMSGMPLKESVAERETAGVDESGAGRGRAGLGGSWEGWVGGRGSGMPLAREINSGMPLARDTAECR